jgi:hypothetical protein
LIHNSLVRDDLTSASFHRFAVRAVWDNISAARTAILFSEVMVNVSLADMAGPFAALIALILTI